MKRKYEAKDDNERNENVLTDQIKPTPRFFPKSFDPGIYLHEQRPRDPGKDAPFARGACENTFTGIEGASK